MGTLNVTVSSEWVKVRESDDRPFLIGTRYKANVEYAKTDADTAPTVAQGIALTSEQGITRDLIGAGYLWARSLGPPVTLVIFEEPAL